MFWWGLNEYDGDVDIDNACEETHQKIVRLTND